MLATFCLVTPETDSRGGLFGQSSQTTPTKASVFADRLDAARKLALVLKKCRGQNQAAGR
jgi:hypothetical protein